jgi:hypothetical protein
MRLITEIEGDRAVLGAFLLAFSAYAGAQTPQATVPLESAASLPPYAAVPVPPGGISVGPMIVYPSIDASIGHNDNLFSSNINKGSSTQTTVTPSAKVEAKVGPHTFDGTFRLEDVRYSSSPADNYTAYGLLGNANLVFTGRSGLRLRAEYRRGIDPRGSTDRAGSATPDEYVNQGVEGIFSYGAPGAQGRIEIDGGAYSRRYLNNRLTTAASDRDTTQLGGTFLWRVAPKTELLALAQRRAIDYSLDTSTQSSSEMRYQVGAKWEATAKTSGIVKYGLLEKKFDASGRTDFAGSSWDASVRWSPLTYSVFDFYTSKATNESTGTGDFLLTQTYGVNWNHAWNSRFSTAAQGSWRKDDFLGGGGGRVDKTSTLGLALTYQWQRWLRFGGSYTWTDRVSNPNTFDYTRNLILFTVGATL